LQIDSDASPDKKQGAKETRKTCEKKTSPETGANLKTSQGEGGPKNLPHSQISSPEREKKDEKVAKRIEKGKAE